MISPALLLKPALTLLLGLTLLAACGRPLPSVGTVAPPLPPSIRQIALLPVVFDDRAQDRYVEYRSGQEILWQARRVLAAKGYRVVQIDAPSGGSRTAPFTPEGTSPEALAAMAPEAADAVLLIRIDHFLDAEIYGGNSSSSGFGGDGSLDIYATAQLVWREENRVVWQGKGFGSAGRSGTTPLELLEIGAARDLADNLLAPLPALAAAENP